MIKRIDDDGNMDEIIMIDSRLNELAEDLAAKAKGVSAETGLSAAQVIEGVNRRAMALIDLGQTPPLPLVNVHEEGNIDTRVLIFREPKIRVDEEDYYLSYPGTEKDYGSNTPPVTYGAAFSELLGFDLPDELNPNSYSSSSPGHLEITPSISYGDGPFKEIMARTIPDWGEYREWREKSAYFRPAINVDDYRMDSREAQDNPSLVKMNGKFSNIQDALNAAVNNTDGAAFSPDSDIIVTLTPTPSSDVIITLTPTPDGELNLDII